MHVMQRMTYSFVHLCKSIPKVREKPSRKWRFFSIPSSKENTEKPFYIRVEK